MYMNELRNYFYFNWIEIAFKDICGSYRSGKRRYNISKTQMWKVTGKIFTMKQPVSTRNWNNKNNKVSRKTWIWEMK